VIDDKSLYSVIGNLYSGQGINAIVRNVMANPRIRTIVIWGAELSLSGHSLKQFVLEGVDSKRKILKGRGEIEKEITKEAIERFRKNVEIVDLRGRPAPELKKTLQQIKHKKPFSKEMIVFPPSQPIAKVLPSEQVGFNIRGKTVAQTWLKVLNEIDKYGRPKHTRYTQKNELKELLNLVAVVTDEDTDNEYFPEYLPFGKAELLQYYPEMTTARRIPGSAYNYGHRMMKHFDVDQIEKIKELLKKRPDSKKMIAVTIDPRVDWGQTDQGDTPCMTQVLGSVQDDKFFLTAHFRSQDMVQGWPRNAFGLRRLQKQIAESADMEMGALTLITHSAHIYSDDFNLVGEILSDNYEKELGYTPAVHFDFDPRGNVIVEVIAFEEAMVWEGYKKRYEHESVAYAVAKTLEKMPSPVKKLIRVTIFEPDGGVPVKMFEGRTAQEVAWQVTDWGYLAIPGHIMYIGLELQKAEEAIRSGTGYNQDPA
jgi:thymidylate synthase